MIRNGLSFLRQAKKMEHVKKDEIVLKNFNKWTSTWTRRSKGYKMDVWAIWLAYASWAFHFRKKGLNLKKVPRSKGLWNTNVSKIAFRVDKGFSWMNDLKLNTILTFFNFIIPKNQGTWNLLKNNQHIVFISLWNTCHWSETLL